MSPLSLEIRSLIEQEGPISIADYMALCLAHPVHGYYTTSHPVGGRASASRSGGDFITAPEVSQMFGELIGVWCMEVWQALGSPSPFNLVEVGPGRGTLMRDLLRASRALPDFLDAAQIHLIEISPTLAEQQSLTLNEQNAQITWLRDLSALPDLPTIAIGNEFLDALPFHQWMKSGEKWHQRAVGIEQQKLCFTTRLAFLAVPLLPVSHDQMPDGTIFETAPAREGFVTALAEHIVRHDGAALLIDYGHLQSGFGDTFQAVRDHAYCAPLDAPGRADLTSHVDFEKLLSAAKNAGCVAPHPTSQGEFLISLGLLERAGTLGANREPAIQESLQQAVNRLAGPDQMGDLFKVMAFGAPASLGERWPGFV